MYSREMLNGLAVTLGIYRFNKSEGLICDRRIFLERYPRNGRTPFLKNVEWKGTSIAFNGIVAYPRSSSIGPSAAFLRDRSALAETISASRCLTSSSDKVAMSFSISIFCCLRKLRTLLRQSRALRCPAQTY